MPKLRLRSYAEVHEVDNLKEGETWKDLLVLPTWLELERSMYECDCEVYRDEDCSCKPALPPLSDYFKKVSDA